MRLVFRDGRGTIEPDDDNLDFDFDDWPNCSVADCPYKVNLGSGLLLCYAHAYGAPLRPETEEEFRRDGGGLAGAGCSSARRTS